MMQNHIHIQRNPIVILCYTSTRNIQLEASMGGFNQVSKVSNILQRGSFFVNCEATLLNSKQVIDGEFKRHLLGTILILQWMISVRYAAGWNTLYFGEGRRAVRYCHRNNPGCLTQTFPGDFEDDCLCSCTGADRERPYIFLLP